MENSEGFNPAEQNLKEDTYKPPSNKTSFPLIAGILLIISGVIAILFWGFMIISIDTTVSMMDLTQLQEMYPGVTEGQISELVSMCSIVFIVLAIFPILGGVLSLKKKLWGIVLAGSILGLFTLGPLFISSALTFIALILVVLSKKEYS